MPYYEPTEPQFRVNSQRAANQYVSSSAALEDGGFVIVWISLAGSAASAKAQLYDPAGQPVGGELLVTSAAATGKTNSAVVSGLDGGGFVVAWETSDTTQDGSGSAIKAQVYDGSGQAVGGEFLVNSEAAGNQSAAAVTTLSDGSFLVSWTTSQPAPGGTLSEVKARLFDAAGVPAGAEFLVNTTTIGNQSAASLAAAPGGGFIATWLSGAGTAVELYGQLFDAGGSTLGSEFAVTGPATGYPSGASVTALADGRFVAVWRNLPDSGVTQTINGQILDAAGARIGAEFLISNAGGNPQVGSPAVQALPDGGFVATWSNPGGTDASTAVWARRYDSSGVPGTSFLMNSAGDLFEGDSRTLVTTGGDIVTAWTSTHDFYNHDVSARIVALNTAPDIQSDGGGAAAAFTIAEDQIVVTQVLATDRVGPEGVSYAIVGGADAALFAIDPATGHLTFLAAPDADAPADADQDNVYEVVVAADDGELADSQALSVTVAATGRGLMIASAAQISVGENGLAAATVSATDATATFAITGGADAAFFTVDTSTGALSFVAAPDFEAPADAGADNVYEVEVTAGAAGQTALQTLLVGVRNVNEGAVFTASAFVAPENGTAAGTVVAADAEGDPVTYSITGGADYGKFSINAQTGALSFVTAPNFEAPADVGQDRTYDIVVRATDGDIATAGAVSITISNVNEGATIWSNGGGATAAFSHAENQLLATTVVTGDNPTGTTITYSISGGSDASKFSINSSTGALSFLAAPNFESPSDLNRNNVYEVTVRASDGTVHDTQALAITVTNVNEPFVITSHGGGDTANVSLPENSASFTVTTNEQDAGNLVMTIVGGADASRFQLGWVNGKDGYFNFVTAPNFEAPHDSNGDNVYHVTISVSDGTHSDTQAIAFTITNVNEAPVITSNGGGASASLSIAENGTAVTNVAATDIDSATVSYSISGGADASKFSINATTGALRFVTAPNFESRTDAGLNNVYDVIVRASDGSAFDTQNIAVTVTNVNEAPVITSGGGGASASYTLAENATNVGIVASTDPENTTRSYSIVGGADAARFTINYTGGLNFVAAPNFESPADAGGNNVYDVVVQASDGVFTDTQAIAVTVTNVNEAPVITSNGGGASAGVTVNENEAAVASVTSTDPENTARTYSISGGADAAYFAIDSVTGALSFAAAPDYEAPADAGGNNVYDIIVRASDGVLFDTQALAVTVADVDGSLADLFVPEEAFGPDALPAFAPVESMKLDIFALHEF